MFVAAGAETTFSQRLTRDATAAIASNWRLLLRSGARFIIQRARLEPALVAARRA